jgi:RNA polymerase sigma-70 factor (ECF subfamily)
VEPNRYPSSGRTNTVELERIKSGDAEALGLLLQEAWAPLVSYLHTFLDSVEEAEDAAQEAFVRLWEHRDRWETGSARALVFRIGRNAAMDLRRRTEVRRRWKLLRRNDPTLSPPTPEEELEGSEFLRRFRAAVENLPPRRREVFELIRLRGLSHSEAAQVLEISYQTVANHLRLAMQELRPLLPDSMAAPTLRKRGDDIRTPEERSSNG